MRKKFKKLKEGLYERSVIIFAVLLSYVLVATAIYAEGQGMMDIGMTSSGTRDSGQDTQMSAQVISGEKIFNANCRVCHQNGGNLINPSMPLRGSLKLADFDIFLSFIRKPRMPDGSKGSMPAFSIAQISDEQARELYQYITSKQRLDLLSKGQGAWHCPYCGQSIGIYGGQRIWDMVGGYGSGMGRGMMGGYGMGPGMMGPGYSG